MNGRKERSAASNANMTSEERFSSNLSEAKVEELINRVCAKFSTRIEAKITAKLDSIEDKINNLQNCIDSISESATVNQKAIKQLCDRIDQLEQDTKRSCLRFIGIKSETGGENLLHKIVTIINCQLNVKCNEEDIDHVFRVGTHNSETSMNTVLVKFVRTIKRDEVMDARKCLKGTNISIFEDLTKQRYNLLLAAQKKFGKKRAWSVGGRVSVWLQGENQKKYVYSESDF